MEKWHNEELRQLGLRLRREGYHLLRSARAANREQARYRAQQALHSVRAALQELERFAAPLDGSE